MPDKECPLFRECPKPRTNICCNDYSRCRNYKDYANNRLLVTSKDETQGITMISLSSVRGLANLAS